MIDEYNNHVELYNKMVININSNLGDLTKDLKNLGDITKDLNNKEILIYNTKVKIYNNQSNR